MAENSLFIVVEGMDGSGKTGITRQLRATLAQTLGENVALTFEPHDPSAAGIFIRDALTKRIKATPLSLALAFALNRADHNARVINPFLDSDKPRIMISDRYTLSSLVYQSTGGLTMEDVYHLNHWARTPDLTIFLNVSPHNCYARMRNRPQDKELFEKNLRQRFKKYQAGMELLRDKGETVVEVDANPTFPEVFASVLETVQAYAPDWLKVQPPLFVEEADSEGNDLAYKTDEQLEIFVNSVNADDVKSLTYAQANLLFKAYVKAHGFEWIARYDADNLVFTLSYEMPIGLKQHGLALILNSQQQAEKITKTIQTLLDNVPNSVWYYKESDFMIVFDNARFEPELRFGRGASPGRLMSPNVQVITREMLAEWLRKQ